MGIGEIRKIYRITNTQNNITSASYYQVVYKYTSENGKAAIEQELPNGRVDTQNQTITDSRVGEAEEYTLNIRIENTNYKTIKLEFIEGQKIVQDDILGGFFTR